MSRRNRNTTGAFTIGGDDRTYPSVGLALSVAQNRAVRAADERSWGIYEDGQRVARVVREADGSVTTTVVRR